MHFVQTVATLEGSWLAAAMQGFALGAGLIIAIGAQNAFVLAQGVRRQHHLAVALTCSLCDAALIIVGVAGMGALVSSQPWLTSTMAWFGAAFLFVYGLRAFRSAWRGGSLHADQCTSLPLGQVLTATLALTLANPHVYLDTVVLVGSAGGRHAGADRALFGGGAVAASFVWFFLLAQGGRALAPLFSRPATWRVLDTAVGLTMWTTAAMLLL